MSSIRKGSNIHNHNMMNHVACTLLRGILVTIGNGTTIPREGGGEEMVRNDDTVTASSCS